MRKYRIDTRHWSVEDETKLLQCYDRLAKQVYPVTVESIKAVVPDTKDGKQITGRFKGNNLVSMLPS